MSKTNIQNQKPLRKWFDQLEITLKQQADLAGIFDHPSLTGTARERFLTDAIRNVLPPAVYLGTGKVVGPNGETSKQIDIVVYDSRFPVLRSVVGIEIFLLEGVIATIEVKSELNKNTLTEALSNCHSVLRMSPYVSSRPEINRNYQKKREQGLDHSTALSMVKRTAHPYTYIFSYNGYKNNPPLMGKHVDEWFLKNEKPTFGNGPCPQLPSLIISGDTIGASKDDKIDLKLSEYKDPKDADKMIMIFLTTKHQFGIFLSHLINAATSRLGLKNKKEEYEFFIKHHLPLKEYFDELPLGRDTYYIVLD